MERFEAVAAVGAASAPLRAAWRERKVIEHKGAIDLVTATEREVEALIATRLREACPGHLVVAEEASDAGQRQRHQTLHDQRDELNGIEHQPVRQCRGVVDVEQPQRQDTGLLQATAVGECTRLESRSR
jgi:3'-phosphoadenosine 5'-phosphosulfate (PAPS) 3'-phosphatase